MLGGRANVVFNIGKGVEIGLDWCKFIRFITFNFTVIKQAAFFPFRWEANVTRLLRINMQGRIKGLQCSRTDRCYSKLSMTPSLVSGSLGAGACCSSCLLAAKFSALAYVCGLCLTLTFSSFGSLLRLLRPSSCWGSRRYGTYVASSVS